MVFETSKLVFLVNFEAPKPLIFDPNIDDIWYSEKFTLAEVHAVIEIVIRFYMKT